MLYAFDRGSMAGISLNAPDDIMNRRFSAGFYPQVKEDADYTYHSFLRHDSVGGLGAISGITDARLLRASKTRQELCIMLPITAMTFGFKPCDHQHAYSRTSRPNASSGLVRRSLTFIGVRKSNLIVSYQEDRSGEATKPERIVFPLDTGDDLVVGAARIRILNADANIVHFRVLHDL